MEKKDAQSYLVGGAVRDMLLGLDPKDLDYVVVGATPEEMIAAGYKHVGAEDSFPVFLHPKTGYEYALARSEKKIGPGYKGFEVFVDPNVTLEEDLMRRDLTINAMAIDLEGDVVDPYGGLHDLHNKILRHTSDAFKEDPVRVLRLARFAARYTDFTIDHGTTLLMKQMVRDGELDHLTPERVWAEFEKGFMEKEPGRMFQVLEHVGAHHIFTEFFDGWHHSILALNEAAENNESLEVRFAIMAAGFHSSGHYKKWTVPGDCSQVAHLLNTFRNEFRQYDFMQTELRVQLFQMTDIFRRPKRFNLVRKAAAYQYGPTASMNQMDQDIAALNRVDEGAIAATVEDKSRIKSEIYQARCEAIHYSKIEGNHAG